jgi:hypothetical protein
MKKLVLGALALAALLPALGHTQDVRIDRLILASAWDMDGEAADADQVITATALVDNGTSVADANWTILAQPDTCRLVNLTIVDTNLNSGTITVTGTGCLGEAKSCAFAFTAGDDTGVKTLTCTDGQGAYLSNVATVTTGTMTGESDETFALGYAGVNSVNGWPMYGKLVGPNAAGEFRVDPFGRFDVPLLITTSGSLSTTVTDVNGADDAFARVSAGDLLIVRVNGIEFQRKITAKASADSITINSPGLNIPATGVTYQFKKFYFSTNPADQMIVPVSGYKYATFLWSVDANADTGGIVTLLECTMETPDFPTAGWATIAQTTSTVNSGATQAETYESIDLGLRPWSYCRFGFKFGTGDDADAADEDINLSVVLVK